MVEIACFLIPYKATRPELDYLYQFLLTHTIQKLRVMIF